jgi:hypothetical protein
MRILTLGICLFLIQFSIWVGPQYVDARGAAKRFEQFIEPFIADAQILNPILAVDAASTAVASKIFEGLVDRDENLHLRGRLATHWEIFEEAYFHVNCRESIPGVGEADAKGVVRFLRKAIRTRKRKDDPVSKCLATIEKVEALPPRTFKVSKQEEDAKGEEVRVTIRVAAPPRIRLVLKKVNEDLFDHLSELLGRDYFSSFDGAEFIEVHPKAFSRKRRTYGKELLPATEHNPVIVFHLRPNVKFHDGHVFDVGDVKFTYAAIMAPRNGSPRRPDYEPIKAIEIIDPLTIRIVYKKLFSLGLSTWGMGILPAHLLNARALREEAKRRGLYPKAFTMRQSEFNYQPIGCGPFKFEKWETGKFIKLKRFEDYWEGAPGYRDYVCRIIPDARTQAKEFFAGELDVQEGQTVPILLGPQLRVHLYRLQHEAPTLQGQARPTRFGYGDRCRWYY